MSVSIPIDRCYYYECADGRFRLTYFMPAGFLRELSREGRISAAVLEDFPDGVDLDCTEPDWAEFEEEYGYRPDSPPDALRQAFLAILSSTREWRSFRGTGLIRADQIESVADEVEGVLEEEVPGPPEAGPVRGAPTGGTLRERRRHQREAAQREARRRTSLEEMPVRSVDGRRAMADQAFEPVRMEDGMSAQEVFQRLQSARGEARR